MTSSPTVAGTVTVGGQPLEEGSITFFPIDGDTPGGIPGASIVDGKFEILDGLREIEYRIAIQGTRPHPTDLIPLPMSDEQIPRPVQVVPKLYRGQNSPETRTVGAGHQDFSLELPEISANKQSR